MSQDTSRIKELQTALRAKMADNKTIADSFKVEDGIVNVSAEQKANFDRNMADIKEIKSLIAGLESMNEVEAWGSQETTSVAAAAAAQESVASSRPAFQTIGEEFVNSAEFKSLQGGRNGANMAAPFQTKRVLTDIQVKDVYMGLPSGTPTQFGTIQRDPIVIPPKRTSRVRDLFPTRTTTAQIIEYFRMTGFTNNAAMVADRNADNTAFGAKPQSTFTFSGQQAPVRTMAHWEAAHRNVLADEPQLRAIIDNELMYGLRLLEDSQILSGDGTGENLTGILNTSGVQTFDGTAAGLPAEDKMIDTIRRAATLAFLAYYEPTGVVVNPANWEAMELTKDENGQYLVATAVSMGGQPRLWRMPVVETPAIASGSALVGAFGQGAQLYDREQASIRISEQHADFFIRNAIVVLAEQRLALAVKRPEAFVKVTLDTAAG
jgi:HK97 family phage major capsid protein